jgi:hypothetical protein
VRRLRRAGFAPVSGATLASVTGWSTGTEWPGTPQPSGSPGPHHSSGEGRTQPEFVTAFRSGRSRRSCRPVNRSMMTTGPPQYGQWRVDEIESGTGGGMFPLFVCNSARQVVANCARCRLAIQPKCRMRTKPRGSTCKRKRRMNSCAVSVIFRFLLPCA